MPVDEGGTTITGTGYTYVVPRGWGPPPQKLPGFDPDSLAVDLQDTDDFADNVNVLLSPASPMTPGEAERAAEQELTAVGASDISIQDRVTVAGGESAHTSAVMSMNDVEYRIEQFFPTDNAQTFVLTFSFSSSVTPPERNEVTDAVLASWSWTD